MYRLPGRTLLPAVGEKIMQCQALFAGLLASQIHGHDSRWVLRAASVGRFNRHVDMPLRSA